MSNHTPEKAAYEKQRYAVLARLGRCIRCGSKQDA